MRFRLRKAQAGLTGLKWPAWCLLTIQTKRPSHASQITITGIGGVVNPPLYCGGPWSGCAATAAPPKATAALGSIMLSASHGLWIWPLIDGVVDAAVVA